MNVFNKMDQIELTESERVFVDYVKHHPDDVIQLNINQLAKVSYVSASTIYRIIDKLELNGLNDLKVHISHDYDEYRKGVNVIDYNYPFHRLNTHHQIINKMAELYDQTIQTTKNLIDLDDFLKAVQLLHNSERIHVFPSIGNYFIAESFRQNMLEIGVDVDVNTHDYYQHWKTEMMDQHDVVIVISYANRTVGFTDVVKRVAKTGAKMILIASTHKTDIMDYADVILYFASYENSEDKVASFSSRVSLLYLLDCLYACYFQKDYNKNLDYKIKHYFD